MRCARHELEQLELRDLSDLLEFVADDTRKPAADDFGQTVAVHKSVNEKQAAIVALGFVPLGLKGWALGRLRLKRLKTCHGRF